MRIVFHLDTSTFHLIFLVTLYRACQIAELNRGGKVGIYTKLLPPLKRESLSKAMHKCKLYRQYTRSQVFHEPRFHVLLSSKAAHVNAGYMYHGIKMKARPIHLVPEVAEYASELARYYGLPKDEWDIGVDMIAYKDGEDSIGWHAGTNKLSVIGWASEYNNMLLRI